MVSNMFYFHPENWGRFQMGWFNHQLEPQKKTTEVPSLERSLQLLGALHLSWMQKVYRVADFDGDRSW